MTREHRSAIYLGKDKPTRVNFSEANQFVAFGKFTSANLFQITREKSCDYFC